MAPILIVDDSAVARHLLGQRLRAAGLTVVVGASVTEGRAHAGGPLRGAILDLELGDGLGTELAPLLVVPVAFFTSEASGARADAARRYGPVFRKPDELDRVVAWSLALDA